MMTFQERREKRKMKEKKGRKEGMERGRKEEKSKSSDIGMIWSLLYKK